MSNLTSTLTIALKDDGLAAKAKADAEALKKLGASGADLKKLAAANPEIARLAKGLDGLAAKGARLDDFKSGARSMREMGAASRAARAEVTKTAAVFAKKQATLEHFDRVKARDPKRYDKWKADGLVKEVEANAKAAQRAHEIASRRATAARSRFAYGVKDQRAARAQLLQEGALQGGRGFGLGAAERRLTGDIEAANAALRQQIGLMGRASAKAKAEHDLTSGMGAAGKRQGDLIAANRRLKAGMSAAGIAGRAVDGASAGAHAAAAPHGRRRGGGGSHGDPEAARDHYVRHHGVVGTAAAGAAGYASAHGVIGGVEHTLKAGANYQHEVVALRNAGRTPEELLEIQHASKATTAAVPTATYEENLKVVNETTGAFGSLEHAMEHLTFMQKAASVVHAAAGDKVQDDAGEMGNKMARFAEERGSAGNSEQFERETGKLVRAMVFTRGNFNPSEMLNFAQQAKSSLQGYNEEFMTQVMPSIVTTMGGNRAGTAANAFTSVIDGKVNDMKQAQEWDRYGLLDKSKAVMKAGHAVGWRTGAILETERAHTNPLEWMENVALPRMKAKGINVDDNEQLKSAFATMFRSGTGNFFANEIGQKNMRSRLHKDAGLMGQVGDMDDIYKRNLAADPKVALTALTASLDNLMTAVSSPAMVTAAGYITSLGTALGSLAATMKDHPAAALAGGTAVAGGALAGAGALSYQLLNGFGLGTSATALDASAAALSGAAAELTGAAAVQGGKGAIGGAAAGAAGAAGKVGALGVIGRLGAVGMGVAAIAAGVSYLNDNTAQNNRMNGNGRLQRRDPLGDMPDDWATGQRDVSGGIGATGSSFVTHRAKTWSEMFLGNAPTRGGKDPTQMQLPYSMGGTPKVNPIDLGTAALKVDASQIEAVKPKADEAKAAVEAVGGISARPNVDASSIEAATTAARTLLSILGSIPGSAAAAGAAVAGAAAQGGQLRGRSSARFSDGPTAGRPN